MTPKWGFGVACFWWSHCASTRRILGARCFRNGHFRRMSSTLSFTVFQTLGGHASARRMSHKPCFRQAHCFTQAPLRFLPVPLNPTRACSQIGSGLDGPSANAPPNLSLAVGKRVDGVCGKDVTGKTQEYSYFCSTTSGFSKFIRTCSCLTGDLFGVSSAKPLPFSV